MHRFSNWPGTRAGTVNMAVVSLSLSRMLGVETEFATLSLCATKAARDEVTTSRAIMMNASAIADSCTTSALRERGRRRPRGAGGSGTVAFTVPPSGDRVPSLSRSTQFTPWGDPVIRDSAVGREVTQVG